MKQRSSASSGRVAHIVALNPEPRVIVGHVRIVGPAVRPVAIDAEAAFFRRVRREGGAVLATGPEHAARRIEVRSRRLVGERVAIGTDFSEPAAQQIAVALAALSTTRTGVVGGMASHAFHLRRGIQRQCGRGLEIAGWDGDFYGVRSQGRILHVAGAVADFAHLVVVVVAALDLEVTKRNGRRTVQLVPVLLAGRLEVVDLRANARGL